MIYYCFLVLSLAVAGLGGWVRRRSEFWGQAMLILGGLGCIGCIAWQVRVNLFQPAAREPDRGQAVISYFLANQVLREVGSLQGTVVLFMPPESVLDAETAGTYAGTFRRVLRGFPDLKVEALTLAVPAKAAKAGHIPLAAFHQVVSNGPAALAYVSFAGVPPDIGNFQSGAPRERPGFFVFDPWGTTNWLGALRTGRLRAVIVPRPGARDAAGTDISGEPREVFDQLYLQATPATADEIAARLSVP